MTKAFLTVIFLGFGLALFLPSDSAQAQNCGGVEEPACKYEDNPGPTGESLNKGVTNEIVKILMGADATCERDIELRYRIDCLRIYYLKVAERLPDSGDYLPIKAAMLKAAEKLDRIITANLDEDAPSLRPREGHKPAAKRLPPLRAVKKNKARAAAAKAAKVVKETELIIIRSGGDPARRTEHYTDIASAVEDNLVILRSA